MERNLQLICELLLKCATLIFLIFSYPNLKHSSETLLRQQENRTIESVMMGSTLHQWFTHLVDQGLLVLPGLPAPSTFRPARSKSSAASGKPVVPFELFIMMNMVCGQISKFFACVYYLTLSSTRIVLEVVRKTCFRPARLPPEAKESDAADQSPC